jgi:hypothetical protein
LDYNERVDVVDLILHVLKEHEKNLDSLVLQLGETVSQQGNVSKIPAHGIIQHKIVLRSWPEFREKCLHSETITFDFETDKFKVIALKNDIFYIYFESLPQAINKKVVIDNQYFSSNIKSHIEGNTHLNNSQLNCGLKFNMEKIKCNSYAENNLNNNTFNINPDEVKLWLSEQLKTEKRAIMFGWIE